MQHLTKWSYFSSLRESFTELARNVVEKFSFWEVGLEARDMPIFLSYLMSEFAEFLAFRLVVIRE